MDITRGREITGADRSGRADAVDTVWNSYGHRDAGEMHPHRWKDMGHPGEETQAWLDAIARERSYAESGSSEHVRPDDELPVNLSGLETLNMTWDLFETAAQMDDLSDRQEMLNFAKWMEESQNLLDWIKLTQAERGGLERRFCLRITPGDPHRLDHEAVRPFCPL